MDELLFGFNDMVETDGQHGDIDYLDSEDLTPIPEFNCDNDHDYVQAIGQLESDILKKTNDNILAYIGGYIIRTTRKKICDDCSKFLTADSTSDQDFLKWIDLKQYDSVPEGKGLIRPSKYLVDLLMSIEGIFNSIVDQCTYSSNVKCRLRSLMLERSQACAFLLSSKCCDVRQLIVNIINIRLAHSLLQKNNAMECEKRTKGRKLLKLSHV